MPSVQNEQFEKANRAQVERVEAYRAEMAEIDAENAARKQQEDMVRQQAEAEKQTQKLVADTAAETKATRERALRELSATATKERAQTVERMQEALKAKEGELEKDEEAVQQKQSARNEAHMSEFQARSALEKANQDVAEADRTVDGESKARDSGREVMMARHERERAMVAEQAARRIKDAEDQAAASLEQARQEEVRMKTRFQQDLVKRSAAFKKRFANYARKRIQDAERNANVIRDQLVQAARRAGQAAIAAARKTKNRDMIEAAERGAEEGPKKAVVTADQRREALLERARAANVEAESQAENNEVQQREADRRENKQNRQKFLEDAERGARTMIENARAEAEAMRRRQQEKEQEELQEAAKALPHEGQSAELHQAAMQALLNWRNAAEAARKADSEFAAEQDKQRRHKQARDEEEARQRLMFPLQMGPVFVPHGGEFPLPQVGRTRNGCFLAGAVRTDELMGKNETTPIGMLPQTCWPRRRHVFSAITETGFVVRVDVTPEGIVAKGNRSDGPAAAANWLSLDGMVWPVQKNNSVLPRLELEKPWVHFTPRYAPLTYVKDGMCVCVCMYVCMHVN